MKNLKRSCFFIYLFFPLSAISQMPILPGGPMDVSNMIIVDSCSIRVSYAFNAEDIRNFETYDDLQRLEIGMHLSKYYSFFLYNNDSLVTDHVKKNPNVPTRPNWLGVKRKLPLWSEYRYSEYFKDFSNNTITEYIRMPWGSIPPYQTSENIPVQQWNIHDSTLIILGYVCQKATCQFRGRNYIAWFTMDIPIQQGPWKFGGLPGLILKVYDSDNLLVFESINIENFKRKYPIKKMVKYEIFVKTERTKLLKLKRQIYENYPKTAGITLTGKGEDYPQKPYYPLELE